jgi:hypothetical protein
MEVDLNNQVVRVLGSLPVKTMLHSLHQTGQDARLIGQGNPNGPCSFFIFFQHVFCLNVSD